MYGIDWLERSVIIVDSSTTIQALLDTAFSRQRGFHVAGFSSDAKSAAELIAQVKPDIVTIDLCVDSMESATLLEMTAHMPGVCKIIVSDQAAGDIFTTTRLKKLGATACLSKRELATDPAAFFAKINSAYKAMRNASAPKTIETGIFGRAGPTAVRTIRPAPVPVRHPVPLDETQRLETLRSKQLGNAVRERAFDLITKHVAQMSDFPVCLLTFIDEDTQWIKSAFGFDGLTTDRSHAFCNYTISQGGPFVVPNALKDVRFAGNPLVAGPPGIRSYVGNAVVASDGTRLGALCLIDIKPRHAPDRVLSHLAAMSDVIAAMIDVRPSQAA